MHFQARLLMLLQKNFSIMSTKQYKQNTNALSIRQKRRSGLSSLSMTGIAIALLLPTSLAFAPSNHIAFTNRCGATSPGFVSLNSDGLRSVLSAAATTATDVSGELRPLSASAESMTSELDWSFVDAVYLITCPNADPGSVRLEKAKGILNDLGLMDKVEIKAFETDDEDRIRGCYTSHISVLKDAMANIERGGERRTSQDWWQQLLPFVGSDSGSNESNELTNTVKEGRQARILVLEDNLDISGNLEQSALDALSSFALMPDNAWDMIHLSYIPYVPNLQVSKTYDENVVKLSCGVGSALGTTAYIINENAIMSLIREDERRGYYAAIPDVMALQFPESRYASYPVPFLRAAKTPSLVNPQLDDLRSVLFQPGVVSAFQSVLTQSGLSSNNLFFTSIGALVGVSGIAGKTTVDAAFQFLSTGSYDGNIILPVLSSSFSLFSLGVLGLGAALAPKPPAIDDEGDETIE